MNIFIRITVIFLLWSGVAHASSEKITLTTDDGYRISGLLTRPEKEADRAGVVLLHMYRNNKESWEALIQVLSAKGITSLAIDMRGHGESRLGPDGSDNQKKVLMRDSTFFNTMHMDAEAAVKYLQRIVVKKRNIGLIGASVGCSVTIHTVVNNEVDISAVVVMTPGEKYLGVQTMNHIKKWPGIPLFILSSKEEAYRGAKSIYNNLKNRGAELSLFDEEEIHGTYMFGEVDGVEILIADWIAEKLLPR